MSLRSASARGTLVIVIALEAATPLGQAAVTDAGVADARHPAHSAVCMRSAEGTITDHDESGALLASRRLIVPIAGIARASLRDTFNERRGASRHEAIDIAAPRGTPVVAVGDGRVVKLFNSVPGGHTVYQFDPDETFAGFVGAFSARLDRGEKPADAWDATLRELAVDSVTPARGHRGRPAAP